MYAVNLMLSNARNRAMSLFKFSSIGLFVLGLFLGTIAVTMWQQWVLTFGQDPVFLLAVSLVLSAAFGIGNRWQLTRAAGFGHRSLLSLVICMAVWAILHPFWVDALTIVIGRVPLSWLENPSQKFLVAITLAGLGWLVPGILWFGLIAQAIAPKNTKFTSYRTALSLIMGGVADGLFMNSVALDPWLGVNLPTLIGTVTAIAVCLWLYRISVHSSSSLPQPARPITLAESASINSLTDTPAKRPYVRTAMAFLVGCLLACNMRLINQLMPHGAFVMYIQISGALCGMAIGTWVAFTRQNPEIRASWGGLMAAAVSILLLAAQPYLVDLSLAINAAFTTVNYLLTARVILLMTAASPFGFALAWIADASRSHFSIDRFGNLDAPNRNSNLRIDNLLSLCMPPFMAGLGLATFVLSGSIDLFSVMMGCGGLLVISSVVLRIPSSGMVFSHRSAVAMVCLLAAALSLPFLRTCDDPSRTAKLLFSTPTFIAYRTGWDLKQLPFLDDVRMIDRSEGRTGPLTLWRGRVAELYVREAGLPRAVVTKHADIVPQFAPEVLQAVYSLVISDRPRRILLLGLSAGVPLSTCLSFPVREAVCFEGDSNLVSLVRGPISRETGYDPLMDDRVTLRSISPELALMNNEAEPFDVILSCPSASSMTEGSASFTQEYYQRASHQLSQKGLFCQRFECVDYGPEPIRMVLKAMRAAFRKVIALEIGSGELLLFASNWDDVFIPNELATRLESSHVRAILARSGLDWSALLNFPSYDHAALGEICDESRAVANSAFNGALAAAAPMEVMRWGNKVQEVQSVFTSTRLSTAPYWTDAKSGRPNWTENEIHLSRRSRLVEWLGDGQVSKELIRRLEEVATQQKLVRENPDAHWWEYRKSLKKQLQERPRSAVQQVKAIEDKQKMHPEDVRRRNYFLALGDAAQRAKPTRQQIAAVEQFLEPYDPLVSYFARQETADMLARSGEDADRELAYRLHVIYFAPTLDASVRNVARALETIVTNPDAVPDESVRFDVLNGLIQSLRVRWEIRQTIPETSSTKVLGDLDQSLIAVEKAITSLDGLFVSAGVSDSDWQTRRRVIERLMLQPLRAYRNEVHSRQQRGRERTRAIFDQTDSPDLLEAPPE